MRTVCKTIKEIINVKTINDAPINSVAAKLDKKFVKAKKPFSHYLSQITDETIFLSSTTPTDIESFINCIKPNKAIGRTVYQQKH